MKLGKFAIILAATAAMLPAAGSAQSFGTNLIVNGDAEAGPAGSGEVVPVPGFPTTTGEFTVVSYSTGNGYPSNSSPGAALGGTAFFSGGSDSPSSGLQSIDVAALAPFIDLGTTGFTLSALLGGFASQQDFATLQISFLGGLGDMLGSASLQSVSAGDRLNETGFLERTATGFVPTGTRSIDVLLGMVRTQGVANDGYADNLSLVLTAGATPAVPEPASWAMMIAGFGTVGGAIRRRSRPVRAVLRTA